MAYAGLFFSLKGGGGVLQLHAGHDAAPGPPEKSLSGGGGGDSDTFVCPSQNFHSNFPCIPGMVSSYITNLSSLTSMPAGNYKIHKSSS